MSEELKDINELIDIAKKINEGKYDLVNIQLDPESELFDLASYFNDAIKKLGAVSDTVEGSYEDLPVFQRVLKEVVHDTEKASESLLTLSDKLNFNIDAFKEDYDQLINKLKEGDIDYAKGLVDRLKEKTISGQDICFDMISSLEFQDITKQKVDKLIKIVRDLERKITDIVIKLGIKDNKIDINKLNRLGDKDSILQDQDLVDELLKEFGM